MSVRITPRLAAIALLICGGLLRAADADNVDLSTVPPRDTVQLTIYNSEDLTLVRETRRVTVHQGLNPLQFSWANTLIDPTSVELRFVDHAAELEVLDTTFPHAKPQMLYWNVQSQFDGEATLEITYFTSGITWSADYVLTADAAESQVRFEGFVRVHNNSGEQYEQAQIRLVVGKLNLVEQIAQLANITVEELETNGPMYQRFRNDVAKNMLGKYQAEFGDADHPVVQEKAIVKEGLSEYFIYTIEGTESIDNGWSKRMRSLQPVDVPLRIQYRYREREYGPQLVRMYLMTNDVASHLGQTPLPDGVMRVFRDNGRGGLSFLVEQAKNYIPIGDKIELNLGPDAEVIFELVKGRVWRDHIWMRLHGSGVFRRVDDGAIEIEPRSSVAGWDEHSYFIQRIRNYTGRAIEVEVRRTFPGDVVLRNGLGATLYDYQTAQFTAICPEGGTRSLRYELVEHQGRNKKQDRLLIVDVRR